jgi:hypothetical protein
MSASSRRAAVALIIPLLCQSLRGQAAQDSSAARLARDAATVVPEPGARSLTDVLSSRVPGFLIVPASGVNGMGARIRLRGVQTLLADRAPLVLVDGMRVEAAEDAFSPTSPLNNYVILYRYQVPIPPGPLRLDDLNPDDVESIEVLPGPTSATMYGPGADAGVLLIRTKRGHPGPPRWEGYVEGGVSSEIGNWPANFGGVDRNNLNPVLQHGGCILLKVAYGICHQDFVQQFNPFDQRNPFRAALRRQYGLSVSGGSTWGDYRLSGTFAGDAGPYSSSVASPDPNAYSRFRGRMSARVRPWRTLELALNAARMSSDLRLPPNLSPQVGPWGLSDSAGFDWSPMFRGQSGQAVSRWTTLVEARWSPLSWIALRGLAGFDALRQGDTALTPYSATVPRLLGSLRAGQLAQRHRTLELAATATGTLTRAVTSTTTLGVQQLRDSMRHEWSAASDPGTGFGSPYASASLVQRENSLGYYVDERLALGQGLILGATLRHDRFKELDRGVTYPSFTATWIAHTGVDAASLSRLAFRAAWGSSGPRPFADAPEVLVPIGTPIPHVDPERTTSTDLGADATLLRGRLGAQVTYYTARSHSLAVTPTAYSSGYGIAVASGTIRNRGIEATITGKLLTGSAVGWDVTLSLWGNQNRLVELDQSAPIVVGQQRAAVGYPVGGYWALPIRSVVDVNGDGIITPSEVVVGPERVWAGTPYPTQGAMLTSEWSLGRSFRAALTLDYRAGQRLFNAAAFYQCRYGTCRAAVDPRTPLAEQARAVVSDPTTDYFEDADYLKLREISLSYLPPPKLAAALRARAATITLAGRNLATWTGYSGGDPESGSYGIIAPGLPRVIADDGALPVPHTWTLRLQLVY